VYNTCQFYNFENYFHKVTFDGAFMSYVLSISRKKKKSVLCVDISTFSNNMPICLERTEGSIYIEFVFSEGCDGTVKQA
jgi:hypothetical protein